MYCTIDLGSTKTEITLFGKDLRPLGSTRFITPFVRKEGMIFLDPVSYGEEIFRLLAEFHSAHRKESSRGEGFFCTVTGMGSKILATDRRG